MRLAKITAVKAKCEKKVINNRYISRKVRPLIAKFRDLLAECAGCSTAQRNGQDMGVKGDFLNGFAEEWDSVWEVCG